MKTCNFKINYPAIHSGTKNSEIFFNKDQPDLVSIFNPGQAEGQKRFFVTDATVASLPCMSNFIAKFDDNVCGRDCLIILGSGEPYKTLESVLTIITKALDAGFTRKDLFVGIGGGVICDLTAFAASIFKRGAAVQFVPTTLLAMVDASIGGKTGCDFNNYKNMIGTFFPAQKIYYWPEFVQSLPDNQYRSGLAEAFKTGILYNQELYDLFKNESEKIKNRDKDILDKMIRICVEAKSKVVEQDFTEQNIRAFLNLGHTFGHALESIAGLGAITHGDAVAWGIGRSVLLSYKKEYCRESYVKEIFEILESYGWETNSIPAIVRGGGIGERFLSVMHKDKKNMDDTIRIIITKGIGDTVIEEVPDAEIISVLK